MLFPRGHTIHRKCPCFPWGGEWGGVRVVLVGTERNPCSPQVPPCPPCGGIVLFGSSGGRGESLLPIEHQCSFWGKPGACLLLHGDPPTLFEGSWDQGVWRRGREGSFLLYGGALQESLCPQDPLCGAVVSVAPRACFCKLKGPQPLEADCGGPFHPQNAITSWRGHWGSPLPLCPTLIRCVALSPPPFQDRHCCPRGAAVLGRLSPVPDPARP